MILCGRFAPSPTGPLHFGSLVAALGSYLNIKNRGGDWLVRIEDLDPPREQAGADTAILKMLEAHGLSWDREIEYQSRRSTLYDTALDSLDKQQLTYACQCSRKDITETSPDKNGPRYPGTCRQKKLPIDSASIRVCVDNHPISFTDTIQGAITQELDQEVGDFIVRRRDGFFAYHLAVVVDDADQSVSEIARGADLLDSTARQIHLQRCLSLTTPDYIHFPIAINRLGQKLSKQTHAPPLVKNQAGKTLKRALDFLGQQPPADLGENVREVMDWARQHWSLARVPRQRRIPYLLPS